MVKLIIRDDDCNFFTRPEDLEHVYTPIADFPVTFAVVPTVTDVIGGCPETKGNTIPRYIGDNLLLVQYLRERSQEGTCDICLHGITHGYEFTASGKKVPEMEWRETKDHNMVSEIAFYKHQYELLFGIPITCFVAPSNRILKKGIKAVYSNGLNFSGIIPIDFQRDFTKRAVMHYIKRFFIRATKRLPYPGIINYGTHLELNAYNNIRGGALRKMFAYCQSINSPMAINVHYWHIREYPDHYKDFFDFIKYAIDQGAQPSRMRDCI